jgi:hypothetical protein
LVGGCHGDYHIESSSNFMVQIFLVLGITI